MLADHVNSERIIKAPSAQKPAPTYPKILILTRGDYMTLQIVRGLITDAHRFEIRLVIIHGDHRARTGLPMLQALYQISEPHYFWYECAQRGLFSMANRLLPGLPLNVASLAKRHAIPILQCSNVNAPDVLSFARAFAPDVLFSAKCPQRIHRQLLSVAHKGNLNIHASLLPTYAGRAPHFWAMAQGESHLGTTAHLMNEKFDDGPILAQRSFRIPPHTSAFETLLASSQLGQVVAREGLIRLLQGSQGRPQASHKRTYYSHPTRQAYRMFRTRGYLLMRPADFPRALCWEIKQRKQHRCLLSPKDPYGRRTHSC